MNRGSLKAIDIQFYTLFFSLASIIISLILTYNQKLIKENKKTLLSDKASYNLSLFNRVLILSIALIFLYVNYKDYKTSNNNKQKKFVLELYVFMISDIVCECLIKKKADAVHIAKVAAVFWEVF